MARIFFLSLGLADWLMLCDIFCDEMSCVCWMVRGSAACKCSAAVKKNQDEQSVHLTPNRNSRWTKRFVARSLFRHASRRITLLSSETFWDGRRQWHLSFHAFYGKCSKSGEEMMTRISNNHLLKTAEFKIVLRCHCLSEKENKKAQCITATHNISNNCCSALKD